MLLNIAALHFFLACIGIVLIILFLGIGVLTILIHRVKRDLKNKGIDENSPEYREFMVKMAQDATKDEKRIYGRDKLMDLFK